MKEERLRELVAKKEKEKRNSQGKDPRTFEGNSQGGDLGTLPPETYAVFFFFLEGVN